MEPPRGILASLWNFICFLPYFLGLFILGNIKSFFICPFVGLIISLGNTAIVLGLWPIHIVWSYRCVVRSKKLGPVLKIVQCIVVLPVILVVWLHIGIAGSVAGGFLYGFLSPIFATFEAVEPGKTDRVFRCFYDGTWSTLKGSITIVRDFRDVCYHSYFSVMDDLQKESPSGKYYEIRLLYLPAAVIVGAIGVIVDIPMISILAGFKSIYMLFRGWHRLFQDLIGREGPFLETICVPFAGLAIILWPLAVFGAVLASFLCSVFMGAFAGVVVYQESSVWFGLCYIVASLSIYDEYSNDILDMPEGSCFPRPKYRKKGELSRTSSRTPSFSRPSSFRHPPSRTVSINNPIKEFKPLELLDSLFKECQHQGEKMVSEGLITHQDLQDAKLNNGNTVIRIGLPAYCLLQTLLRSAKANSGGILLSDNTEINSSNRPKEAFFDWFFNPLLIIKDQIIAENLSEEEEDYLCKLVLLSGDPLRLKSSKIGPPPESERKRAELDALARRLRGITKSISRYPTFKRRFENLVKNLSEDLARKNYSSEEIQRPLTIPRSKSAFARIISNSMFLNNNGANKESQAVLRDLEIQ